MPTAAARHILVKSEEECSQLKEEIEGGADFAALAAEHSQCPSGKEGGDLGKFGPGQMVPEFDKVVFSAEVGTVQGRCRRSSVTICWKLPRAPSSAATEDA